jgi:hypothetical protein
LLIVGLGWAAWLDPWSLSEPDPAALPGSARMATRQAQAVVLGMAFLQLTVARLLCGWEVAWTVRLAAGLTAAGAVVYVLGSLLCIGWPAGAWLIPAGALLNAAGFAALAVRGPGGGVTRVLLGMVTFGMVLDGLMGLFTVDPAVFRPAFLGADDGVRLRMLRLARAAAVALPVLALLCAGLTRRGLLALAVGAVLMPTTLTLAALTAVEVKYLLPVPALAAFGGTVATLALARRAAPLERFGWALVASSLGVGLLMGLYAFDGPLPAPAFLDGYSAFARRLSRLAHAYAVVLGILAVFLAREPAPARARLGVPLFVAGSLCTLAAVLVVALAPGLVPLLSGGPALTALAVLLCVLPPYPRTSRPHPERGTR